MKSAAVVLGLIRQEGRWFLQRRDLGNPVLPGRWEFPGGKAGPEENLEAALKRELREELGWAPSSITALAPLEHRYADRIVRLHPFQCAGEFTGRTSLSWGWVTMEEMRRLPMPGANLALLERLI